MEKRSKHYLDQYLSSLPVEVAEQYSSFSADYLCGDEYNANLCADLIVRGEKQATCSMEYWYSQQGETMPEIGHLQVVTNWHGDPICIVEISSVSKCKFKDVTPEFAAAEGEGDKSLAWWVDAHWTFFSQECEEAGIAPSPEMLLVLERFKVVYQQKDKN